MKLRFKFKDSEPTLTEMSVLAVKTCDKEECETLGYIQGSDQTNVMVVQDYHDASPVETAVVDLYEDMIMSVLTLETVIAAVDPDGQKGIEEYVLVPQSIGQHDIEPFDHESENEPVLTVRELFSKMMIGEATDSNPTRLADGSSIITSLTELSKVVSIARGETYDKYTYETSPKGNTIVYDEKGKHLMVISPLSDELKDELREDGLWVTPSLTDEALISSLNELSHEIKLHLGKGYSDFVYAVAGTGNTLVLDPKTNAKVAIVGPLAPPILNKLRKQGLITMTRIRDDEGEGEVEGEVEEGKKPLFETPKYPKIEELNFKKTNAFLRFRKDARYHPGAFIYKLTSDKGYQVTPDLRAAMRFTTKKAAESYIPVPKYSYFMDQVEAVTVEELLKESKLGDSVPIKPEFYMREIGSEEADDLLFALQVMYGQPKWGYSEFEEMNLSEAEIQRALDYVTKRGFNKSTYFEDSEIEDANVNDNVSADKTLLLPTGSQFEDVIREMQVQGFEDSEIENAIDVFNEGTLEDVFTYIQGIADIQFGADSSMEYVIVATAGENQGLYLSEQASLWLPEDVKEHSHDIFKSPTEAQLVIKKYVDPKNRAVVMPSSVRNIEVEDSKTRDASPYEFKDDASAINPSVFWKSPSGIKFWISEDGTQGSYFSPSKGEWRPIKPLRTHKGQGGDKAYYRLEVKVKKPAAIADSVRDSEMIRNVVYTHILVPYLYGDVNGNKPKSIPMGTDFAVHHLDADTSNNSKDNLLLMSKVDHDRLEAISTKVDSGNATPEEIEELKAIAKKYNVEPEL